MGDFFKQEPRRVGTNPARAKARPHAAEDEAAIEFDTVELDSSGAGSFPLSTAKLNDAVAATLAVMLMVAPMSLGANRPLAWLVFAIAISLLAIVQVAGVAIQEPGRPMRSRAHSGIIAAGFAVILFSALQLLPAGGWSIGGVSDELLPNRLTVSTGATSLGLVRLASYALLFVLALEIGANAQRAARFMKWLFWGVFLHAVWALVALAFLDDSLLFSPKTAYEGFATGTFVNRNSFATFLSMGLMIGFSRTLGILFGPAPRSTRPKSWSNILSARVLSHAALACVILAAVAATGSRLGAFSALAGTLFLLSLIMLKSRQLSRIRILGTLAVAALIAIMALLLAGPLLAERMVLLENNALTRLELFKQSLAMIAERPLLGFGLDGYSVAFEMFHQPGLDTSVIWDRPHNTVLTLWSELGVVAGSIPVVLTGWCFCKMLAQVRERETTYVPAAAAAAAVVAASLHSMGDFSLEVAANTYLFIAIVAIGISKRV